MATGVSDCPILIVKEGYAYRLVVVAVHLVVVAVHSSLVDQVAMTHFRKDRAARSSYDLEVGEAIGISRNVATNYSFDPCRATHSIHPQV
jgi:hypothetical protein